MSTQEHHLDVHATKVIDYPPEWADDTGPFGGAYAWALKHMVVNTEVIGSRVGVNTHGRPEVYKFRLILGPNEDIRGKMECDNGNFLVIRNGYLGLVTSKEEWTKRWIILGAAGKLTWWLEWERRIMYQAVSDTAPATAYAAVSKCSDLIGQYARTVRRNWCVEVFGQSLTTLRERDSSRRHLIQGPAMETHRQLFEVVRGEIDQIFSRTGGPNGTRGPRFGNRDMDRLVAKSKLALGL